MRRTLSQFDIVVVRAVGDVQTNLLLEDFSCTVLFPEMPRMVVFEYLKHVYNKDVVEKLDLRLALVIFRAVHDES